MSTVVIRVSQRSHQTSLEARRWSELRKGDIWWRTGPSMDSKILGLAFFWAMVVVVLAQKVHYVTVAMSCEVRTWVDTWRGERNHWRCRMICTDSVSLGVTGIENVIVTLWQRSQVLQVYICMCLLPKLPVSHAPWRRIKPRWGGLTKVESRWIITCKENLTTSRHQYKFWLAHNFITKRDVWPKLS